MNNFNYENYLAERLDFYNTDGLKIVVANEQIFERERIEPDEIFVVIKRLASYISWEGKTEPIQLTILTEANSLNKAKALFERLAEGTNWETIVFQEGQDTYTLKQQYASPIDMNNFLGVENAMRSVLYVSATLIYLKNVINVDSISIDGIANIKPLSLGIAYQMQGNTQQISGDFLATTEKSVSTLVLSLTLPMQNVYVKENTKTKEVEVGEVLELDPFNLILSSSDELAVIEGNKITFGTSGEQSITYRYMLVDAINYITSGNYSGNKKFVIEIPELHINRVFKLTGANYTFAPNETPKLVLGWIA